MRSQITILQNHMRVNGLDAYIIFSADSHGSEYVHEHFKFREWLSGFSGSNGTLLVTLNDAYLWTDSRYFIQAANELKGTGIRLMKAGNPGVPSIIDFVCENISEGHKVGLDARTINAAFAIKILNAFNKKKIQLIDIDFTDMVWNDRPPLNGNPFIVVNPRLQGKSFEEKIEMIRSSLTDDADMFVVSGLDDIAWVLNLRGSDIPHTPVFYSYLVIKKKAVRLYIFEELVNLEVRCYLAEKRISVRHYNNFYKDIAESAVGNKIALDLSQTSYSLYTWLSKYGEILSIKNPINKLKSIKSMGEIGALLNANIRDGRAMVRFIYWLKKTVGSEELTELSVSDTLDYLRKYEGAIDTSFDTIAGYASNGAIVHYKANELTNKTLEPEGFLLVDSGGQYLDANDFNGGIAGGTTDITRTIALGKITDEMKTHYTAVLQGMIDLAIAIFPEGTRGSELDSFAHKYLWEYGLDYAHGTGHGIGFALSVHEPYVNISRNSQTVFEAGMVTSDEPGVYLENKYGIRIENDLLCVLSTKPKKSLAFETLTLCPFEREAIDIEKLTIKQRRYINNYHKRVYDMLSPGLEPEVAKWLAEETLPI